MSESSDNSDRKRIALLGWIDSVHIRRWAEGLAARGFEVKVFSLGGRAQSGIDAEIIPRSGRVSYLTGTGRAARAIRAFRPHLVHAHYATGFGWWLLRSRVRPRMVSVWGADIIDFPNNWFKRTFVRRILTKADQVTATSRLLKQTALGLAPEISSRLSVIPFGVTIPPEVSPPPPATPVRLCFIKAHSRKYGPDILIKAMAEVVKKIPNIELSIAGEGEMTPTLRCMTEDMNLSQNVRFEGYIDNKKIYNFIRRSHVMVMPSVMKSESFGVAVLEAGACGRAVVASEIGGVPEVLVDGRTGLLVPPGDVERLAAAILRLANDAELRTRMGQEGYSYVKQNYDWEHSLDAMSALYERLTNDHM